MTYDIKASLNEQTVRRVAHGDLQAWLIVNQLTRDGCINICMSERGKLSASKHVYFICLSASSDRSISNFYCLCEYFAERQKDEFRAKK